MKPRQSETIQQYRWKTRGTEREETSLRNKMLRSGWKRAQSDRKVSIRGDRAIDWRTGGLKGQASTNQSLSRFSQNGACTAAQTHFKASTELQSDVVTLAETACFSKSSFTSISSSLWRIPSFSSSCLCWRTVHVCFCLSSSWKNKQCKAQYLQT